LEYNYREGGKVILVAGSAKMAKFYILLFSIFLNVEKKTAETHRHIGT